MINSSRQSLKAFRFALKASDMFLFCFYRHPSYTLNTCVTLLQEGWFMPTGLRFHWSPVLPSAGRPATKKRPFPGCCPLLFPACPAAAEVSSSCAAGRWAIANVSIHHPPCGRTQWPASSLSFPLKARRMETPPSLSPASLS